MLTETYTLSNGVKVPKIGYGTWMIPDDQAAKAVKEAIQLGYRHIDTAQAYENEAGVGQGMRESGVAREELFLTTKLAAEIKDYPGAVQAIETSLKTLDLEYIDLMIIHSPKPWAEFQNEEDHYFEGNLAAWKALTEAYAAGKIRAIGVSNFEQVDLENLLENAQTPPMVNQILAHIGQMPTEVIDYSQAHDILVEAYSPIAHGEMMKHPEIAKMAEKYAVSIPQLAIRFLLQLDLLPLPKASSKAHMENNAAVDFTISDEDMTALKAIKSLDYGSNSEIPVFKKVSKK
ncbi:2,5-diketo-D-gluconic acid reductase [Enterococcus sp. JM4C]|uniref:aldo/keto reductase n=1 Tax=Candidatus Enterococcus huntleyi TaxID=1857217 RepID=UPI00137AF205|nr:aldo/keto reductase [Enterococcus sp. JM4C]KAF1297503.1 2,5-diketo-D-gluconic acid reductase [Enterococcus sp. JM4C]